MTRSRQDHLLDSVPHRKVTLVEQGADYEAVYDLDGTVTYFFNPSMSDMKDSLQPQCITMMGLPASGKSTFVKQGNIRKYLGVNLSSAKISNSDVQLKRTQYQRALADFNVISRMYLGALERGEDPEEAINRFRLATKYYDNYGKHRWVAVGAGWMKQHMDKGASYFYDTFRKAYYANFFDLRHVAKSEDKKIWDTKVVSAGNILVIDTVAATPHKIISRMEKAASQGMVCSILYLERAKELCYAGDNYRYSAPKQEGRGVGKAVIDDYFPKMEAAWKAYEAYGQEEGSVLNRLMHFTWRPTGDNPVTDGQWDLVEDHKFGLKRQLAARTLAKARA